jgi:hypothetical protein
LIPLTHTSLTPDYSIKSAGFILVSWVQTSPQLIKGPSWPWSYGSWIYNYLCNQYLSPHMLWVRISIRARCTTLGYKVCQWLVTGRWFSLVSSTNKTERQDIVEIVECWKWR